MKKLHRLHTHSHTGNFHTQCVTFPREESFYCKSTACMYVFTRVLQLFWKGLTGDQRCTSGEQMMFVVSFTDSLKSFQNQAVQLHSLFSFLKNLTSTRCETTVQQCKFICSKWYKINKECVRNVSLWFNLVNITRWVLIYVNYVYVLLCRTLTDLLKQQGGEVSSVENATASSPNGGRANGVSARMLRSRSGECWERPHTHIQTHNTAYTTDTFTFVHVMYPIDISTKHVISRCSHCGLTVISGGQRNSGRVKGQRAAKQLTTVQDCVWTIVSVKPVDICKETQGQFPGLCGNDIRCF